MSKHATEIFGRIIEHPESKWYSLLEDLCGPDRDLRAAVFSLLLSNYQMPEGFLEGDLPPSRLLETPETGARIGPYEILEPLGAGGMGAVYLARRADGAFEKEVAVKLLSPSLVEIDWLHFSRRMRVETTIQARLNHRNIAAVYDGGTSDSGMPYVVMEYVDGPTITEFCDRKRLRIEDRIALIRLVCDAVEHAHANLVLHLDLKPANILVTSQGEPRIVDFGIARLLGSASEHSYPEQSGAAVHAVTPTFASPEQLQGASVGTASDAYSLGLVLFELLTGIRPFDEVDSVEELLRSKLEGDQPLMSQAFSDLAGRQHEEDRNRSREIARRRQTRPAQLIRGLRGLDAIVAETLRPTPSSRLGVARLNDELHRFLAHQPSLVRPPSRLGRLRKFLRRHPSLAAVYALAFVLLLTAGMWFTRELQQTRQELRWSESVANFLSDVFLTVDPANPKAGQVSALEMVQLAVENLEIKLKDTPEVQSLTRWRLATLLSQYGELEQAEALMRQTLSEVTVLFGKDSPDRAGVLNDLGNILGDRGFPAEARVHLEESLRIKLLHPDRNEEGWRRIISSYNNLGANAFENGQYEDAIEYFEQALEVAQEAPDEFEWAARARLLLTANLGAMQIEVDRERARTLLGSALSQSLELFGETHPETARILSNLAELEAWEGQLATAAEHFEKSIAILRHLFESPHQQIEKTQTSLVAILANLGRLQEAETMLREVLEARIQLYAPESDSVAFAHLMFGVLERVKGRHAESAVHLETALRKLQWEAGASPELGLRAAAELCLTRITGGDLAPAKELFDRIAASCNLDSKEPQWPRVLCRTVEAALLLEAEEAKTAFRLLEMAAAEAVQAEWEIEVGGRWLIDFVDRLKKQAGNALE